jgi:hypothetical protein
MEAAPPLSPDTLSKAVEPLFDRSFDARLWTLPTKLAQLDSSCRSAVEQMWKQTAEIEIRRHDTLSKGFHVDVAAALRALMRGCPKLESLCLQPDVPPFRSEEAEVHDVELLPIARCTKLQSIALIGCAITDCGVWALAASCPSLTAVNMRGCRHVSQYCLQAIFNVVELDLGNTSICVNTKLLALLAKNCPKLRTLSCQESYHDEQKPLPDGGIDMRALSLLHLEELYLGKSNSMLLTSTGPDRSNSPLLALMALLLPKPVVRGFNGAPLLSLRVAQKMVHRCPLLGVLDLSGWRFAPGALASLLDPQSLCKLMLNHAELKPADFVAIATCKSLRHCEINNTSGGNACVKDAFVVALAEHATGLTHLSLYGSWSITDRSILALASCATSLEEVDITFCDVITFAAVHEMVVQCPRLFALGIEWKMHGDLDFPGVMMMPWQRHREEAPNNFTGAQIDKLRNMFTARQAEFGSDRIFC